MENTKKIFTTRLNEHDKKVLNKYAGIYSNFIESNTVKTDILKRQRVNRKIH